MIKFLLEEGADPKHPSLLEKTNSESILEVAIRWSHYNIVEYLLSEESGIQWDRRDI